MTPPLRVAVVGVGRWGVNLARAVARLDTAQLCALCDGDAERLAEVAELLQVPRTYGLYDELLADPDIDALMIATPPETHAWMGRQAVEAGKHVFVEKPLATSLSDGLALERVATASGKLVMAGHLLRYHGGVAALRRLVAQGELGKIDFAVSRRLGWRAADRCGPWWSLAPHDLSVLRGVLDSEPLRLAATAEVPTTSRTRSMLSFLPVVGGSSSAVGERSPRRVVAAAEFAGEITALIDVGLLDESKMRRVVVVGRRAMARFEDGPEGDLSVKTLNKAIDWPKLPDPDAPFTVAEADALLARVDELSSKGERWHVVDRGWKEPLGVEIQQFVAACENPKLARVEMDDALAILRALEAGARSMRDGGRCVKVPEPPRQRLPDRDSVLVRELPR